MTDRHCERMPDVRAALSGGQWPGDVMEHALDCEACSSLWMTACLLERAHLDMSRRVRLDADVVWWKARLHASRRDARRAGAAISGAQVMALAGGAVALVPIVSALRAMLNGEPLSSTSMELLGSLAVLLFAFLLSVARTAMDRRGWRMNG
jgi:hypothetical protein